MKANHNTSGIEIMNIMLYSIIQKYKNESKSQLKPHKIMELRAVFNNTKIQK